MLAETQQAWKANLLKEAPIPMAENNIFHHDGKCPIESMCPAINSCSVRAYGIRDSMSSGRCIAKQSYQADQPC